MIFITFIGFMSYLLIFKCHKIEIQYFFQFLCVLAFEYIINISIQNFSLVILYDIYHYLMNDIHNFYRIHVTFLTFKNHEIRIQIFLKKSMCIIFLNILLI